MQRGAGGRDYGDASADINPNDVESVTVLKEVPLLRSTEIGGKRGDYLYNEIG